MILDSEKQQAEQQPQAAGSPFGPYLSSVYAAMDGDPELNNLLRTRERFFGAVLACAIAADEVVVLRRINAGLQDPRFAVFLDQLSAAGRALTMYGNSLAWLMGNHPNAPADAPPPVVLGSALPDDPLGVR